MSLRPSACLLLAAGCFLLAAAIAPALEIEAEGVADAQLPNARETALADALREAVRQGVGVDILSATQTRDFTLDYDRVFAASFGHVRRYDVLETRVRSDGFYVVRVRADVQAGNPDLRDRLALMKLVRLKQAPRCAIRVVGSEPGAEAARGWLEERARDLHFNLLDPGAVIEEESRLELCDRLAGAEDRADWRAAGVVSRSDLLIEARVKADGVAESLYGVASRRMSVGLELRVLRADNGAVVAAVSAPTRDFVSTAASPDMALRESVRRGLDEGDAPGVRLFEKLLAAWCAELDLGAMLRLEFAGLSDAEHDRLLAGLSGVRQVSGVWPREFDAVGLTLIEVETRLNAVALKAELARILPGWRLDGTTANTLRFSRGQADTFAAGGRRGVMWVLIAAGVACVLLGAFLLIRRR